MRELVLEICRYYRDFLETDFKRRSLPKRTLRTRDRLGHLVGVNLRRYPGMAKELWSMLIEPQQVAQTFSIARGRYRSQLAPIVRNLIEQRIQRLPSETMASVRQNLMDFIIDSVRRFESEVQALHASIMAEAERLVVEEIIEPMSREIDQALGDTVEGAESLFALEDQLVERLVHDIEEPLGISVIELVTTNGADRSLLEEVVADLLGDQVIREHLMEAFSSFAATDLYQEMHDLTTTTRQSENQDFYLCLGEVRFGSNTFSMFQLRFSMEQMPQSFKITVDPRLFVNKRALEYVSEEYGRETERPNRILVPDRIIYLDQNTPAATVIEGFTQSWAAELMLQRQLNWFEPRLQSVVGSGIHFTNNLWISLFDKSEESLVNDYEQILTDMGEEGPLARLEGVITQFLLGDPQDLRRDVDKVWNEGSTTDHLVFEAPIPISEEQRKILIAARNPKADILAIQGPPGTGKSHTITALVFDTILNKKSILILSDKNEALDVVEDKIQACLSKVRVDESVQNSILRLGRAENTFRKITTNASIQQIRQHHSAFERREAQHREELARCDKDLRTHIQTSIDQLAQVSLKDVARLSELESHLLEIDENLIELAEDPRCLSILEGVHKAIEGLDSQRDLMTLAGQHWEPAGVGEMIALLQTQRAVGALGAGRDYAQDALSELTEIDDDELSELQVFLQRYEEIHWPLFGFLFTRSRAREIDTELAHGLSVANPVDLHRRLFRLKQINQILTPLRVGLEREMNHRQTMGPAFDLLVRGEVRGLSGQEQQLLDDLQSLPEREQLAFILEPLGADLDDLATWLQTEVRETLDAALECVRLDRKLTTTFDEVSDYDFVGEKSALEELHTHRLAHEIDGRVLDFVDNRRGLAGSLKDIIRKKSKFPKEEFDALIGAFPCIIASIREFAEYIPLAARGKSL